MDNSWKKHLLKSGLPFEYEVKECFVKNKCTVWDEYSYLKKDENNIEKEFSYDLDANMWNEGVSIDFMIECKYKTEPTKWFFTPDPYSYQLDLNKNSFLHPIDHFSKHSFIFNNTPFDNVIENPLGPFCLKGVEVYKNQSIETNIRKAINQLSYAFVDKIIEAFDGQLEDKYDTFKNSIFLKIPIIITNADLYLINENVTTKEIENANSIEEISSKQDFLIFDNKAGENLRSYNFQKLIDFFSKKDGNVIKKRMNTFTEDINHFVNTIASNYSPECILIMNHSEDNYKKLFDYINFLTKKSDKLGERIKFVKTESERRQKEFEKKFEKELNAVQHRI